MKHAIPVCLLLVGTLSPAAAAEPLHLLCRPVVQDVSPLRVLFDPEARSASWLDRDLPLELEGIEGDQITATAKAKLAGAVQPHDTLVFRLTPSTLQMTVEFVLGSNPDHCGGIGTPPKVEVPDYMNRCGRSIMTGSTPARCERVQP